MMNSAVLFSGGKDSCYSVYWALNHGFDVKYLLTMLPQNPESYMFHYPCLGQTSKQAKSMGIKHILAKTSGEKEKELADLSKALRSLDIDYVFTGALASSYQKYRIESLCEMLGLKPVSPFWGADQYLLFKRIILDGFEIRMVSVSAEGLGPEWVGRKLDLVALEALSQLHRKYGISIGGEGGEFETFVTNSPLFSDPVPISGEKIWKGTSGYLKS